MAKTRPEPTTTTATPEYTVVARRYRPRQFAELIGQEHVAAALVNALTSNRVAHAYLFTGARGTGKTSAARILAKALNCEKGPTPKPCDACESCRAIADGQDVDVVEIDGASNNGVNDIRELRQNVGFLPTRGRYKVYIIDEVHMLSGGAFNALLKTLEEPPPHVKFIFATTEVQKLPITILSRCQRFDFAHVGPGKIFEQLKAITAREGHEADDDALRLVARRAAGSMRDSQSLLDQLLASGSGRLTAEHVHTVLGTAGDDRVNELAAAILARDPKSTLALLGGWVERGLQVGELLDQLIEYWRALMLSNCGPDLPDLPVSPNQREAIIRQAGSLSLDTILAGLEVWTATKARTRGSGHAQVLLEMAVVRMCRMDELLSVGQLVQAMSQPGATLPMPARPAANLARPPEASDASKKNGRLAVEGVVPGANGTHAADANATVVLSEATLPDVWARLIRNITDRSPILANHLKVANLPAIFGPNSLAIRFEAGYSHAYEACATEFNVAKLQDALRRITGQPAVVRVDLVRGGAAPSGPAADAPPVNAAAERKKELMNLPLFRKAADVLGAQVWHLDAEFNPVAAPAAKAAAAEPDSDDDPPAPATDPDEA